MARDKNKDGKKEIEVIAVDYQAQVAMLEGELKKVRLSLIEKERRHVEVNALIEIALCFIVKKFTTIRDFKKLGGWRNIWMWASIIPFLIDFIVQLICIVRKDQEHACHDNDARVERLNKWCSDLGTGPVKVKTPKFLSKEEAIKVEEEYRKIGV